MSAINDLIKNDIRLPSPPAIAIRILEAAKKDDASYEELAQIILSDPSLAAKALKAANTSIYGLPQRVDSLEKALAILGLSAVKNIALSFVIARELRGNSEGGFDFDFFWKRSVTAAVASDLSALLIGHKSSDAFVTGLLQDIGIVIMHLCREEDYLKVLNEKRITGQSVVEVEKKVFGFDHQELGSEVLKQWGLPESIYLPIRYHHKNTETPKESTFSIDTLFVSDRVSSVYHGQNGSEKVAEAKALLKNYYGKSHEEVDNLIDSVAQKSIEILSLFEIDPASMKPYSQILEEANEALAKLNLSYEQVLLKYKEARDRAENLAVRLKKANEKLRVLALRDGLTGLFNHKCLMQQLDTEMNRAKRYNKPLSLIMLDLDYFKKVNDTHGHRVGDVVLQKIGALLLQNVRTNDIVARYGGEEFAVVCPETDLKGAAILSERIRLATEQAEIKVDSVTIRITTSIGVAVYIPGDKAATKSEMFDGADSALYESKRNGRNKLSMVKVSAAGGS